ncbi:Translocation protein SEC62 [Cricetulus griseus]|uniref:Translocation protein SEC62 n=1 Tax=Cricetulus griseus TaxID=10029 RepID=G3HI41_CRIGR|nr:Translocation protein SEC62 [Cricetulus griseus]
MPMAPYEEEEDTKEPEIEVDNNQESRETDENPTSGLTNPCGELQASQAKAWDGGKEEPSKQGCDGCDGTNGVGLPVSILPLPGTHELVALRENHSLADIQKWTVDDVHNFIRSLPGCSDYAQVFKDHAIDGETLPLLTEQHLRGTMGLKLGPALKIQSQEVGEPSKEEKAVAKYLRFNCPTKSTNMMGHRVDYFIASKAVDCLLDSKWAKAKKGEEALFTTRESVVEYCNRLLKKQFFHRALKVMKMKYDKDIKKEKDKGKSESGKEDDKKSKKETVKEEKTKKEKEKKKDGEKEESKKEETPGTPKKKETKKKFKLEPHDDQVFLDGNEVYVWIYDPVHIKTFVMGLILARCILFLIIWLITGGRHHFWFLPNLTADVGFIDSFRPLYTHEYKGPKADLKKDERSETKKQHKSDSEEKSDSEKKEDEEEKASGNHGTDGSGGERHSDTDSDRREDDRSQHSSGNGNDFEMITKEELEQQTDGDCDEEDDDKDGEMPKSAHEKL